MKKTYRSPKISTEQIKPANSTSMGGNSGKVCNGNAAGGRKDRAGNGCTTLLT